MLYSIWISKNRLNLSELHFLGIALNFFMIYFKWNRNKVNNILKVTSHQNIWTKRIHQSPCQTNSQILKSIPERKLTQGCRPLNVKEITKIMKKGKLSDDVQSFVLRIREYMISRRVDYDTMVNQNNGLMLGKDWVPIMERNPALFKDLTLLSSK